MTAALAAACLALAAPPPFAPTGELDFAAGGAGASAAFDADHVIGPGVNMARVGPDAWKGDLRGRVVQVTTGAGRIRGPNVELVVEEGKDGVTLRGSAGGRRYDLTWGPKGIRGKVGRCSVELTHREAGAVNGQVGCLKSGSRVPSVNAAFLKVRGEAEAPLPPTTQFALALVAVLPG